MSEIDPLGNSTYLAGIQSQINQRVKDNKSEKTASRKTKFSDLLKEKSVDDAVEINGLPPELSKLSFDDAIVALKDAVDEAGNNLSENISDANIAKFKKSVRQFLNFVVNNNYDISKRKKRRYHTPLNYFSSYNNDMNRSLANPEEIVNVVNEKLDALAKGMLMDQADNLKILKQVNEIKGLIVDLMQS